MKVTTKLIGSYMSKSPPLIYMELTPKLKSTSINKQQQSSKTLDQSSKSQSSKYIFNIPADIQRKIDNHFVKIQGQQTVMFTQFSHEVLTGYANLILSINQNKTYKFARFKIYGNYGIFKYLSASKFHIQQKGLGLAFAAWLLPNAYFVGTNDFQVQKSIITSDRFSQLIGRGNWKLIKQQQHKLNDARKYLKNCQRYYQDKNMIIVPFFQKFPIFVQQSRNSVINYLCVIKNHQNYPNKKQSQQLSKPLNQQDKRLQKNQTQKSKKAQKAYLIITYRSLNQIKQILQQKDAFQGINQNMGLLRYIREKSGLRQILSNEQNYTKPNYGLQEDEVNHPQIKAIVQRYELSNKKNKYQNFDHTIQLQNVIHIIQNPQLLHSQEFYQLFNKIDKLCHMNSNGTQEASKQSQENRANHIFYGYGIKSSSTSIHDLIESYYKGVRFYSICAKLLKFIPNITLNHYSYWNPRYQKQFINLQQKINQLKIINPKSNIQLYRPFHELSTQSYLGNLGQNIQKQAKSKVSSDKQTKKLYKIREELLKLLQYPLMNNSLQFRMNQEVRQNLDKNPYYNHYKTTLNKKKFKNQQNKQRPLYDPKVIFLGTNSKSATKMRNVSGIVVEFDQQNLCLLDCGPGTYQQFVHHYQPSNLNKKLQALKIMFITHLHADHNLGILDMISKRNEIINQKYGSLQNKIFLIIPFNMIGWIHYYCRYVQNITEGCHILFSQTVTNQKLNIKDEYFDSRFNQIYDKRVKMIKGKLFQGQQCYKGESNFLNKQFFDKYVKRNSSYEEFVQTLDHQHFKSMDIIYQKHKYKQPLIKENFQTLLAKLNIVKFMPTKVFHCPQSYGIVIQYKNGLKISYSGDCRPSPQFLKQAQNSKLLIHQATYQTQYLDRAIKRLHSTFHQALQAGLNSKCETVCLTHFTPSAFDRGAAQHMHQHMYKPEVLQYYKKGAIIAVDHLQFKLSQMLQASYISKVVSKLGTNSIAQKNQLPNGQGDKKIQDDQYEEEEQQEQFIQHSQNQKI